MRSKVRFDQIGDRRQRTFFAYLPISVTTYASNSWLRLTEERRWWETVTVEEEYQDDLGLRSPSWVTVRFVDEGK